MQWARPQRFAEAIPLRSDIQRSDLPDATIVPDSYGTAARAGIGTGPNTAWGVVAVGVARPVTIAGPVSIGIARAISVVARGVSVAIGRVAIAVISPAQTGDVAASTAPPTIPAAMAAGPQPKPRYPTTVRRPVRPL
jgi:hypothetical protein